MSIKIFMKFGSQVKGTVKEEKHKDWIELQAVNFGTSRSVSQSAGSGQRSIGTASVSSFSCSKVMDKASPDIFTESVSSTAQPCEIHFVKGGDKNNVFMSYKLENSILSNYQVTARDGIDDVSESFNISFTKLESIHTQFDPEGKPESPKSAGYDIIAAKKM